MFKHLAEDVTFLLIKNKMLDIQSYEIYLYAVEVIILNGSILLTCLLISILSGELFHMLAFILFFIPLRMLAGGYHCKRSEVCFLCSIGVYGLSIVLVHCAENLYVNIVMQILGILSIIVIIVFSPLINSNHPLEKYQIKRNKKIIYGMIAVDFVLYAVFYKLNLTMASSEIVFIILVALTLLLGTLKNIRNIYRENRLIEEMNLK